MITPDCRYVAWDSVATNLSAPAQTQRLVYRRDLMTGTNVLISQRRTARAARSRTPGAIKPRMSADGNVVAFATCAKNLSTRTPTATIHTDVFARVVSTDHTELVSRTPRAPASVTQGAGFYTSISADGRYVAFDTPAENVTAEDANSVSDVVVRDRAAGTTTLVSRATGAGGAPGDYHSSLPAALGRRLEVAFVTYAENLGSIRPDPETPLNRANVYVRDMAAATTVLASRANGAAARPATATPAASPASRSPTTARRWCSTRRRRTSAPRAAARSPSSRSCATSRRTSPRRWRAARRAPSGR